jgi:hypothetical protein
MMKRFRVCHFGGGNLLPYPMGLKMGEYDELFVI